MKERARRYDERLEAGRAARALGWKPSVGDLVWIKVHWRTFEETDRCMPFYSEYVAGTVAVVNFDEQLPGDILVQLHGHPIGSTWAKIEQLSPRASNDL